MSISRAGKKFIDARRNGKQLIKRVLAGKVIYQRSGGGRPIPPEVTPIDPIVTNPNGEGPRS